MKFLVAGGYGCIGAWVVYELVSDTHDVVTHVAADISGPDAVTAAADDHGLGT